MAIAKWETPGTRTSIDTTTLNGITTGAESANITYTTNSTAYNLYAAITVKLGAPAASTSSGGSISLRVTVNDGANTADAKTGGDIYSAVVLPNSLAKVVIFPMVRIYPFSLRFSVINNTGQTFAGSGNEVLITPYNEDVS